MSDAGRYRNQAYEVTAIRWTETNLDAVRTFLGGIDPPGFTNPGWWFVREDGDDEVQNYVDMDFRMDFEPTDPMDNEFFWGESVGKSGGVVDIPLNSAAGEWVGRLLIDNRHDVETLRDMLDGVLADD